VILRAPANRVAAAVAAYIGSAYWFTASTSFANPAVTIARTLTDSFAGIAPADVPMFVVAQLTGALAGLGVMGWLLETKAGSLSSAVMREP
jgi:glycerol uptake facilitator-like aquaporin